MTSQSRLFIFHWATIFKIVISRRITTVTMACIQCKFKISEYATKLILKEVKSRYFEKLDLIKYDPYECVKCSTCQWNSKREEIPCEITSSDIYNYFVVKKSTYTHTEFRCYKSLESYQLFAPGWVKSLKWLTIDKILIITAEVS